MSGAEGMEDEGQDITEITLLIDKLDAENIHYMIDMLKDIYCDE